MCAIKVTHVQTSLPLTGNAAYRLHLKMIDCGINSKMLHLKSSFIDDKINVLINNKHIVSFKYMVHSCVNRIYLRLKRKESYTFSYPNFIGSRIDRHPFIVEADVIYLHWFVGGFLNFKSLEQLFMLNKPVIIFMHDMWAITGGCHHSFDCENYKSGCIYCPMFSRKHKHTLASKEFDKKYKLYSKYKHLYFVSPSAWMDNCVAKSLLTKKNKHFVISNIVDEKVFKKIDKKSARSILNIDMNKIIISFGCVSTYNKFKGIDYLLDALELLDSDLPIQLLVFGTNYQENIIRRSKYPVLFMGTVTSDFLMAVINNATDIYVSPSLAESFGLTFLENLLCETPIIGFNNTAVPEMIKHKTNGYLVDNKNVEDLAEGIKYLIENRMIICEGKIEYNSESVIQQHIRLLNMILYDKNQS